MSKQTVFQGVTVAQQALIDYWKQLREQPGGMHAWLRLPLMDSNGHLTMVLCHDELLPRRQLVIPNEGQTGAVHTSSPRAAA